MAFSFVASADNTPPHGVTASVGANARNADSHGNLWGYAGFANNVIQGFAPDGTIIQSMNWEDVIDLIRSYVLANSAGSGWTAGLGGSGHFGILRDGTDTYLAVYGHLYQGGLTFFDTLALFETAADGTLAVAGVTWTHIGYGVFDDAILNNSIDIAQSKTFADPIVTWMDEANHQSWGKIWPSVDTIVAEQCCVFDSTRYVPTPSAISTDDFYDFGLTTGGFTMFAMPHEDGGTKTKLFFYVNSIMQGNNHDAGGPCPFLEDNYASYPTGFMAEIDMGVVAEPTVNAVGTAVVCGASAVVPAVSTFTTFTDVATYFDGTTGTGSSANDYLLAPYVEANGDGTYKVIWYQPFNWDNTYAGADYSILGRLKVQTYDPATGIFTDSQVIQGPMALVSEIGGPGSGTVPGSTQVINWALSYSGANIFLWSIDGAGGSGLLQVWLVEFGPSPRRAQGYQRICRET